MAEREIAAYQAVVDEQEATLAQRTDALIAAEARVAELEAAQADAVGRRRRRSGRRLQAELAELREATGRHAA